MIRIAYEKGVRAALAKFALGPPTQVDDFVANVEHGKDAPLPAEPPMSHAPPPPALDGTTPLQMPTPEGIGSTVGVPPPPMMGGLS